MNRGYWNRAARCAAALFFLVALGGCGAITSVREAMYYNSDMARKANDSLKDCRATSSLEIRHPMDHRPASAEEPDCYSVVISTSSRALGDMSISPSASSGEYRGPMAPQEFGQASSAAAVLGQIAWPAVLSKIVYRRYAPEANRSDCNYEAGLHPLGRIPIAAAGRWESWETTGDGCKAIGGLFYETFIYRLRNGPVTQAFIVFRGTENYSGQALTDWSTNFAMAMNIEPSQFKDVRRNVKVIIARLREQYPGVRIFTAGHSLGGSLAQLAAYVSKDIDIAYAFNTSPVSGWTALREQQRAEPAKTIIENEDPAIIRVVQEKEALGLFRIVSNAANTAVRREGRTDVALDFPASHEVLNISEERGWASSGIELHSITLLACNLTARVAASKNEIGAFGFTAAQASAILRENTGEFSVKSGDGTARPGTEGLCQVVDKGVDCDVNWTGGKLPTTCSRKNSLDQAAPPSP